ncbi:MAG: hypothetical protein RDA78_03005 [Roseibium sp.]|uniref:recombinase family protein n=1 Tax=Roseibium sp. TaxID=1936156 RepID=UPI003D9C5659
MNNAARRGLHHADTQPKGKGIVADFFPEIEQLSSEEVTRQFGLFMARQKLDRCVTYRKASPGMSKNPYETQTFVYSCVVNGCMDISESVALKEIGADTYFEDVVPKTERSQLKWLKFWLQSGDTVYVYKLDRFGLCAPQLFELLQFFKDKEIKLTCLKQSGELDDFIAQVEKDLASPDPQAGNLGVDLHHLYEIEIRASSLSKALAKADEETARNAETLQAMVGDLRQHLSFIKQQIRHGQHEAAVGRIDSISADF